MIQKKNNNEAFTLVEVLIGVSILAVTMTAMAILVIVTIRANTANMHTLQAYYLAEQGLDGMKNVRDSNWMQNYGWNMGDGLWGDGFECDEITDGKEPIYLTIDENMNRYTEFGQSRLNSIFNNPAPWDLVEISGPESSQTQLYEVEAVEGYTRFTHNGDEESFFSRYIMVEYEEGCDVEQAKISAVIEWNDHGVERDLILTTYLTNWQTL